MRDFEAELRRIVLESTSFIAMMRVVRRVAPPEWSIGGGTLRALVWDSLHGRAGWRVPKDIDVVYFDASEVSVEAQSAYETRLLELEPDLPWDVSNQARVHLWYGQNAGIEVQPFTSMRQAVAAWSEYAHCVSVRLKHDDSIEIVAPFGLSDLFSVTIRRNPARITVADYQTRTAAKRYADQWPAVTVVSG